MQFGLPGSCEHWCPKWSNRGLSANQNARALISMMARSKCSNQRPDTLMQDRSLPARRNHLQRTAGPYIRVKLRKTQCEQMSSGLLLKADIARYSWHVANVPILLKKSFLADERNFSARLVRSARGNVREPHRLTQKPPRIFASALRSFVA